MNGSIFCRNSRKAILNPYQHGRETQFLTKSFGSLFFRKGTVLGIKLWYGVVAATAPRVTAQDSFNGEPGAFDGAIFAECFKGVLGACRGKAAAGGLEW